MRTTQRKGDTAVANAISYFTSIGMDVSIPLTESAAYDIVVDNNHNMKRVQVRFSNSIDVELRRIHSNSKGYVINKTKVNAYDWLYVLSSTNKAYLFKKCFDGRRSIRLKDEYLV
jgi:hypothetical protein